MGVCTVSLVKIRVILRHRAEKKPKWYFGQKTHGATGLKLGMHTKNSILIKHLDPGSYIHGSLYIKYQCC